MTQHRKLTAGDLQRLIAEIRAQLPDGYDPYLDHWCTPFDCDCCAAALDDDAEPAVFFLPEFEYRAGPPTEEYPRAG